MYFPKADGLYGSEFIHLRVDKKVEENKTYQINYQMKKTHWIAMDNPDKRCDGSFSEANTTRCITRYLEQTIGCSMGLAGSDKQIAM